ncbi:hypothetical protein [Chondromyces crocatus]|uniref:Uncharacterized protein n=1 Tax=Chondromyces crocatus TaxID=52 RepID=A0A0K1EMA0_CHOCO|nr:hypothetical protein [Chondromyces crocatus]AKT41777.1 uncharacterized protein CMC5_059880 [Chondromyces crocatus]
MNRFAWLAPLPLCLALVGCDGGNAGPEVASVATAQGAVADTEIAVPADYEEKAKTQITTDSYKKELDQLEAEIKK